MTPSVYAKSPKGLWVKAELSQVDGLIHVYWQTRHTIVGAYVSEVGPNGEVLSELAPQSARRGVGWVLCGSIPLDQPALHELGDAQRIVDAQFGVAHHVVDLIVNGYGDSPEEVVEWFHDLALLEWVVVGASYVPSGGMFDGFDLVEVLDVSGSMLNVRLHSSAGMLETHDVGLVDCWESILSHSAIDKRQ